MEELYRSEEYLNSVLSGRYAKGSYEGNSNSSILQQGMSHHSYQGAPNGKELENGYNNDKHVVLDKTDAVSSKLNGASVAPSVSPSIDQLLKHLSNMNIMLWRSAEELQTDASEKVKCFVEGVNALNIQGTTAGDDVADALKCCDEIVRSISRKYEKTRSLQLLKNLESMLKVNYNAASLIYNWDDTVKDIRKMINAYKSFNECQTEKRLSLFFDENTEMFNYKKALELKECLVSIKVSKELYLGGKGEFAGMAQAVEEFTAEYEAIVEDVSEEISDKYFYKKDIEKYSDNVGGIPEANDVFPKYTKLYANMFDGKQAVDMMLQRIITATAKSLSIQFSAIWEQHVGFMQYEASYSLSMLLSAVPSLTKHCFDSVISHITKKSPLIHLLLSTMVEQGFLRDYKDTLGGLIADVVERYMGNFEAVDELFTVAPEQDFLSIATVVFTSLELDVNYMCTKLEEMNLKERMLRMQVVPVRMLGNYACALNDMSSKSQWDGKIKQESTCISDVLSKYEDFLSYVKEVKVSSKGILTSSDEPDIYGGISWLYNRCFIWNLRPTYAQLMTTCSEEYTSQFSHFSDGDLPKYVSITIELECHKTLSKLLEGNKCLRELLKNTFTPCSKHPDAASVICCSTVNVVMGSKEFATDYLTEELFEFVKEENIEEAMETLFFEDSGCIEVVSSQIIEYIACRASAMMESHYTVSQRGSLLYNDEGNEVSPAILLVGEYFTLLLPLFSDEEFLPFKILARAFTKFIDGEFEALSKLQPKDPLAVKQHKIDVEHLILLSNYCGAELADSLELLLEEM